MFLTWPRQIFRFFSHLNHVCDAVIVISNGSGENLTGKAKLVYITIVSLLFDS